MDEPTSVLTPQEVEQLFVVLRQLAKEGCSILYISHKLHEIKALCDTATILRGGKLVDTCDPKAGDLALDGREDDRRQPQGHRQGRRAGASATPKLVVVEAVDRPGAGHFGVALDDISFTVRAGEILGIAGVAGNGQNALLTALSRRGRRATTARRSRSTAQPLGELNTTERRRARPLRRARGAQRPRRGRRLHARPTTPCSPRATGSGMVVGGLINSGAAEDLHRRGDRRVRGQGARARRRRRARCRAATCRSTSWAARSCRSPTVLVVSQPTWGVDAGAAAAIHQALVDLAAARLGDRRHQPGPRRAADALRHARGDQRRPALARR